MRRILAVLSLAAFAACGGDSSTNASASFAGTYNLTSVNGAGLPYVIQATNPKVELVSDQYIVSSNGTFTQTTNIRITSGTTASTQITPDAGTYVQNGNTVTLKFNSDASSINANFTGNTFTITEGGFTTVYTRQ